ncbi:MAG TPA: hypothetical protein VF556_03455 [Pyrinomonadaceae bacterium]|jgi:hypothetical protein
MGLDLVELVMRFEEEFETDIPDQAAGTLFTAGDTIDYLMTKPEVRNKYLTREAVARKVWLIIEDEIGIDVSEYNEKSRFIEDMHID